MSALAELRQTLRAIEEHLERSRGNLVRSRQSLTEAIATLTRLDPDNPETMVPPGLRRCDDQLEQTLTMVNHVLDSLRNFAARL